MPAQVAQNRTAEQAVQPVDFYARDREPREFETPPFKVGETVQLKGTLYVDNRGNVGIDPVYDGGITPTTRTQFNLGKLEDHPELKELLGTPAEVSLKVDKHLGVFLAHSYAATLTVDASPSTVPDYKPETLEKHAGRYIGLEGRVVGVDGHGGPDKHGTLTLELDDGTRVSLQHSDSTLTYRSGILENSERMQVAEGDRLRMAAFVHVNGSLSLGRHPYMTQPNESRAAEYTTLRTQAAGMLSDLETAIKNGDFASARQHAGNFGMLQSTRAEREQAYASIGRMPEAERPILNEGVVGQRVGHKLTEAYGENVYAMTRSEFADYALRLGTLQAEHKDGADLSYAYRLLDPAGVPRAQQEQIFKTAFETLAPSVIGVESRHVPFENSYMLERAVTYLGLLRTESAADYLVEHLAHEVKSGNFLPAGWKPGDPRPSSIVSELSSALRDLSSGRGGLGLIEKHERTIRAIDASLNVLGDEPFAQQHLQQILQDLQQRREAPQAFHQLKLPNKSVV